MPYTKEHKKQSRDKILKSAVKLFTRQGFDNTSIDEVMADAQFTRGAFYAHFKSKADLYQQSIINAASQSALVQDKPTNLDEKAWLKILLDGYLSMDHVEQKNVACPLAFMATDVAIRDKTVRSTYSNIYKHMNKMISEYTKSYSTCNESTVYAVTAMMIGGVAIARALNQQEEILQLLDSCKEVAQVLLDGA